jgi:hypothetical protein
MENCQSCYTCEKGISPEITSEEFAAAKGNFPKEWFTHESKDRCEMCYECQSCITDQDGAAAKQAVDAENSTEKKS